MRWSRFALASFVGLIVGIGTTLGIEHSLHRHQEQQFYSSTYVAWRYQVMAARTSFVGNPTVGHSVAAANFLYAGAGTVEGAANFASGAARNKFGFLTSVSYDVANACMMVFGIPSLATRWQDTIHRELTWILRHTPAHWANTTTANLNKIEAQTTRFQNAMEVLQSRTSS